MNSLKKIGRSTGIGISSGGKHPHSYSQMSWLLTHSLGKRPRALRNASTNAVRSLVPMTHCTRKNSVQSQVKVSQYNECSANCGVRKRENLYDNTLDEVEEIQLRKPFEGIKQVDLYHQSPDYYQSAHRNYWRCYESTNFYNLMLTMPQHRPYLVSPIEEDRRAIQQTITKFASKSSLFVDVPLFVEMLTKVCTGQPVSATVASSFINNVCTLLEAEPRKTSTAIALLTSLAQLQHQILKLQKDYARFLFALNSYCLALLPFLDIPQVFKVCHCYRLLGSSRIKWPSSFPCAALSRLQNNVSMLTQPQLVQLYYFISTFRHMIKNLYELERCIAKYMHRLNIVEIGVVNLAYFKTNRPITNSALLAATVAKVQQTKQPIDHCIMTTVWKSLRYNQPAVRNTIKLKFLEMLNLSEVTQQSFGHLVHYACCYSLYEPVLVDEIKRRLLQEVQTLRLKDIYKFVMYISRVCYHSEHANLICKIVANHLESTCHTTRQNEIEKYRIVFFGCVISLSLMDKYMPALLDIAADPVFLRRMYLNVYNTWEVWYLDGSVRIDFPQYERAILPDNCRKCLSKYFWENSLPFEKQLGFSHFTMAVSWTLKQIFKNNSCVVYARVAPQYLQANLILCLDKEFEQGVSITPGTFPQCSTEPTGIPKDSPPDVRWLACELLTVYKVITGTQEPNGVFNAKLRHLRKLGYTSFIVTEAHWHRLSTQVERVAYLRECVNNIKHQSL